jgi:hypothetical protein
MRITALLVLCLAIAGCATKPPPMTDEQVAEKLARAGREINAIAANQAAHPEVGVVPNFVDRLNNDLGELRALSQAIPAGTDMSVAAHYFTARADDAINHYNRLGHSDIDAAKAKEAADNYAVVIAYGKDVPYWGIKTSEVLYFAGGTAFGYAKNYKLASQYWHACSDLGQGGCMNNVAGELSKRPNATDSDKEKAFGLYEKISLMGIQFRCGALYSAVDAAQMIHFHEVTRPAGDEFTLLGRARDAFTILQKREGTADPCSGAVLILDEYMMHADNHDLRPALLDEVILLPADESTRHIAEYLHGDKNQVANNAQTQADAASDCSVDFYMLWRSVQLGTHNTAAQLLGKLEKNCEDSDELRYSRKLMAGNVKPKK